jgi:hypothetical protein
MDIYQERYLLDSHFFDSFTPDSSSLNLSLDLSLYPNTPEDPVPKQYLEKYKEIVKHLQYFDQHFLHPKKRKLEVFQRNIPVVKIQIKNKKIKKNNYFVTNLAMRNIKMNFGTGLI